MSDTMEERDDQAYVEYLTNPDPSDPDVGRLLEAIDYNGGPYDFVRRVCRVAYAHQAECGGSFTDAAQVALGLILDEEREA